MNFKFITSITLSNDHNNQDHDENERDESVVTKVKPRVKRPSMFKVILHNDDYTTMDFVIDVLRTFFAKTQEQAMGIMLQIHHDGVGVCGVYSFEVAESKCQKVTMYAKQHGHPLKCSVEKE